MRVLGVTGGTGCGKSVVCRILKEQGGKIIDADKITRKLQEPGEVVYDEIRDFFGSEIILPEGGIDRKKLGAIVFSDISKKCPTNLTNQHKIKFVKICKICRTNYESPLYQTIKVQKQ